MKTPMTVVLIIGIIVVALLWYQYQPSIRIKCYNGHLALILSWWKYYEQEAPTGDSMWFRVRAVLQLTIK